VGPRLVATLQFPPSTPVPERAPRVSSTVSPETVRLLAEIFALEARLAQTESVVAAFREDGFWESPLPEVARLLNAYFGGEARFAAFPSLASEPLEPVAQAVAELFGAQVTFANDSPGESPRGCV
jgi:hypothetical protein